MSDQPPSPDAGRVWLVLRFDNGIGYWQGDSVWPDAAQAKARAEELKKEGVDSNPVVERVSLDQLRIRLFETEQYRVDKTRPVLDALEREIAATQAVAGGG